MPAGRPRQFATPEQMQDVIDSFFDTESVPTVTGLALALDLTRQGLIHYEGRPEFSDTITKAKARVELFIEKRLFGNAQVAGPIFNLKNNFGWKDRLELEAGEGLKELFMDWRGATNKD